MNNPLFTDNQAKKIITSPDGPVPASPKPPTPIDNPAVTYIRQKIDNLYATEPQAETTMQEAVVVRPRSKHQQYMFDLSQSGKSIVEIQTAWHNYYHSLSEADKHQVWHEFYEANSRIQAAHARRLQTQPNVPAAVIPIKPAPPAASPFPDTGSANKLRFGVPAENAMRTLDTIKSQIIEKIANPPKITKVKPQPKYKSLLFGLGMGIVVVFIFMFSFFNQLIITPFIQPSRHITALPLIITSGSVAANSTPEVIIPKINVEIPVIYSAPSDNEANIENLLENGVVHYPSTVLPGQVGNAAFFGHSSNNIFNPGKYKFAFVLLHEIVNGDTFYLTYNQQVYVYQVISHQLVSPSDVAVLGSVSGQTATASLITCDPPGTDINRLIVVGKQISPNPDFNAAATASTVTSTPKQLASNGPSLWSRLWNDIF
jgi:LPXTG-site transpeptidase (sortase) family protein